MQTETKLHSFSVAYASASLLSHCSWVPVTAMFITLELHSAFV